MLDDPSEEAGDTEEATAGRGGGLREEEGFCCRGEGAKEPVANAATGGAGGGDDELDAVEAVDGKGQPLSSAKGSPGVVSSPSPSPGLRLLILLLHADDDAGSTGCDSPSFSG
mgnify:CR=1 FL=1